MQIDTLAFFTILGMACATYATRAGGLWLMSRVTISKRVEAWLRHIPGTIVMSIVAPEVISGGYAELLGVLVTVLAAVRTGNLLLSMIMGVSVVWVLRLLM
jgi:uncharacterized membrane protein